MRLSKQGEYAFRTLIDLGIAQELGRPMLETRELAEKAYIRGPLAPIRCVSETAYLPCSCPDEDHCGLRILMQDVRDTIRDILDRHSLADVGGVTLRKIRRDKAALPFLKSKHNNHCRC